LKLYEYDNMRYTSVVSVKVRNSKLSKLDIEKRTKAQRAIDSLSRTGKGDRVRNKFLVMCEPYE